MQAKAQQPRLRTPREFLSEDNSVVRLSLINVTRSV